jgi:hypothetical protein
VDTIREEEKYGNYGGNLSQVGRSFVTGVAKLTNFISSAVDVSIAATFFLGLPDSYTLCAFRYTLLNNVCPPVHINEQCAAFGTPC